MNRKGIYPLVLIPAALAAGPAHAVMNGLGQDIFPVAAVFQASATVTGNGGQYGLQVSSGVNLSGLIYTNNGNAGIGTTAPNYGLEVVNPTGVYFSTAVTADNGVYFAPNGMLAVGGKNAWMQNPTARLHIISTATSNSTFLKMSKYYSTGSGTSVVQFYDYGDAALMEIGYTGLSTGRVILDGGSGAVGGRIRILNHSAVETLHLDSNGNSFFNGGSLGIGTASTPRGKLDVYGVDSEIFVGNTAGRVGIIGNSRRSNYSDVLLARNLQGTSGSDDYRTKDATTGGGYAAIELRHAGDVAVYGQNGDTTAGATVVPAARLFIKGDTGAVGIGTINPAAGLDISSDSFRVSISSTITSAGDPCSAGVIRWDSGFVYVCVAANTWKRAALSAWP